MGCFVIVREFLYLYLYVNSRTAILYAAFRNYARGCSLKYGAKVMEPEKLAYTTRQAAQMLSICERTLWTLTSEGKIKALRIGRAVRYSRTELVRFLTSAEA